MAYIQLKQACLTNMHPIPFTHKTSPEDTTKLIEQTQPKNDKTERGYGYGSSSSSNLTKSMRLPL